MSKIFEYIIEFLSAIQIALFPLSITIILALVSYFYLDSTVLAVLVAIIGIIISIIFTNYIVKKHGASNFNARVDASPDLDDLER